MNIDRKGVTMKITKKEKKRKTEIKIKGSLSIYEVSSLKEELLTCLKSNKSLSLDLSEVSECDTAGIQILYSALRMTRETDKEFLITSIKGMPNSITEIAARIGLDLTRTVSMDDGI